jgi:hypothetical protein
LHTGDQEVDTEQIVDASEVREVPDNQEVFSDPTHDQSIIVEVVEETDASVAELAKYDFVARSPVSFLPDTKCRFHFDEIADVGGAVAKQLDVAQLLADQDAPLLPPGVPKALAIGTHKVCCVYDRIDSHFEVVS